MRIQERSHMFYLMAMSLGDNMYVPTPIVTICILKVRAGYQNMSRRCLQAWIVNVPISPARPPVRKRNRFLTPISLNSQICDIFNDPDFWCKDRTRRKKSGFQRSQILLDIIYVKYAQGKRDRVIEKM